MPVFIRPGQAQLTAILFLLSTCLAAFFFTPRTAHAFEEALFSPTEIVGFAYAKLTNNPDPDFKSWVKRKKYWIEAYPAEKEKIMEAELMRLRQGYTNYVPEFGMIDITSDLTIYSMTPEEEKTTDKPYLVLGLDSTKDGDIFFPFQVGDKWIAVIPKEPERIGVIPLPIDQYLRFKSSMWENKKAGRFEVSGHFNIVLQPVSADSKSPMPFDGIDNWLMMAEIAAFTVWDKSKTTLLHEYTAPWYVSAQQRDLLFLHKR